MMIDIHTPMCLYIYIYIEGAAVHHLGYWTEVHHLDPVVQPPTESATARDQAACTPEPRARVRATRLPDQAVSRLVHPRLCSVIL
jgi:hypothetical protein